MTARRPGAGFAMGLVVALVVTSGIAYAASPPAPTRVLATRLERSGRIEAMLRQIVPDPLGGPASERQGRLALERPGRIRLDYADGETVTLREDGGEWLQPRLRQMLVFGASGAGAMTTAWDVLLGRTSASDVRSVGPSRWRMRPAQAGAGLPDSIEVELDGAGLPRRMIAWTGGESSVEFRLANWRSTRARGRAGFALVAPRGFEVIAE